MESTELTKDFKETLSGAVRTMKRRIIWFGENTSVCVQRMCNWKWTCCNPQNKDLGLHYTPLCEIKKCLFLLFKELTHPNGPTEFQKESAQGSCKKCHSIDVRDKTCMLWTI